MIRSFSLRREKKGAIALTLVLFVTFLLVPIAAIITLSSSTQYRIGKRADSLRKGYETAERGVKDYLNLFSETYYADHYDASVMGVDLYNAQFDRSTKSVLVNPQVATKGAIAARKLFAGEVDISALFQFRSDALRFALASESSLTIDASSPLNGQPMDGGMYVRGNLNVATANLNVSGRPVIVEGNVTAGPGVAFAADAPLYHAGALAAGGATLAGPVYDFAPPMESASIDLSRFKDYNSINVVGSATWTFTMAGPDCRCVYGPDPADYWTVAYQDRTGWPVLVVKDGNLTLSGQCNARLTVVSYSAAPSATQGNIFVTGDTGQIPGVTMSASTSSFAALASNQIVFKKGGAQTVYGYYFAPLVAVQIGDDGTDTQLTVNGTVHISAGLSSDSPGNRMRIIRDPSLNFNLPPGIPEKPFLVNIQLRK